MSGRGACALNAHQSRLRAGTDRTVCYAQIVICKRGTDLNAPCFPSLRLVQVGTLQMHGTGTALGDPIEMNAALACLMSSSPPSSSRAAPAAAPRLLPLALSAAKSSAGHAEAAAGIVGVACSALALEARVSPAVLHLRHDAPALRVAYPDVMLPHNKW